MPEPNLIASAVPLGRAYEILEDGSAFGGYTIVRCLAYDMLGSLYLVQNRESGHRETLFVFPTMVSQDRDFNERFLTQSKKLCSLKHANLLSFVRPQIIQNNYCLVGEPFEGLNLPDHLMLLTGSQLSVTENTQAINLPTSQVTPILEQVLTALAYAHECKVMHLNLNPTKILRSTYGEIKVYGFHFLAILGQELFEVLVSAGIPPLKLDPNRSFLGTTDILSPEARLRHPLEYRSDIYALGVDTHWLLTGRKPTSPYKPPSQLQPNIEPGWDAFIIRCLQRILDERYPSATSALTDLRNLAQLVPVAQKLPLELLLPAELPAPAADPKKGAKSALVKKNAAAKAPRRARKPVTKLQRLLLIGIPAVLAIAVGAYCYVLLMSDDELAAQKKLVAVRAKEGQAPRLRLGVFPRNAQVTIRPGENVFQVSDGDLALNIAPGNYSIEVESPNYHTQRLPFTVQAEPDRLFFTLEPAWATVDFTTVPGATIRARPAQGEPIYLGVAPDNGVLHVTRGLAQGNFTFEASKADYQDATLPLRKIDFAKSYQIEIKPTAKPANTTLISDPAGVTVRLGDRLLGVTPLTTSDIPVDADVTLSLERQGYRPVARTIRVRPNATEQIDLGNLAAKTGELALAFTVSGQPATAEQQRDAKIVINGRAYPGSTHRLPNVTESTYKLSFQHPDYFPVEQTAQVVDGKTAEISVDLQPRPARLVIHPNPAVPISVFLNDRPLAQAADGSFPLPPSETAKLRVESQNYAGAVQEFTLGPNQTGTWEVPLHVLPAPKPGENYTVPYLNLPLNWMPAGSYTMGSPATESGRNASEGPATSVTIPVGFWAGVYEVTQEQYQTVMGENPSEFGRSPADPVHFPVERVSWLKAVEFARRVNEREQAARRVPEGYEYRLPTEAEWEYFARAGATTVFNFGDRADPSNANFKGSYPRTSGSGATATAAVRGTRPIGSFAPNAWGLYDIHGNVSEWVLDAFKSRLPGNSLTAPALQEGDASAHREYRGGSWNDFAVDSRVAWRDPGQAFRPDTVPIGTGLRLVLAPKIVR